MLIIYLFRAYVGTAESDVSMAFWTRTHVLFVGGFDNVFALPFWQTVEPLDSTANVYSEHLTPTNSYPFVVRANIIELQI